MTMPSKRFDLFVNGKVHAVNVVETTPLLYVLRNQLGLWGSRFGCGAGSCGSCTVLVAGSAIPSCNLPIEAVGEQPVETVEGLTAEDGSLHPLQQAILDEQAAQCGYCLSGIMMSAKALLARNPRPTREEIAAALVGHLCRCGAQPRLLRAVTRAAALMAHHPTSALSEARS